MVAVNPQGSEALLDTQRPGPGGSAVGSEDLATLLRVASDKVLSTALLTRNEAGAIEALAPGGEWNHDEVITTNGIYAGGVTHPAAMIVTLTVDRNRVRLRSAKPFIEHGYHPDGQNMADATQARFADASGRGIAAWFGDPAIEIQEYVSCDTLTGLCTSSRTSRLGQPSAGTFVAIRICGLRPHIRIARCDDHRDALPRKVRDVDLPAHNRMLHVEGRRHPGEKGGRSRGARPRHLAWPCGRSAPPMGDPGLEPRTLIRVAAGVDALRSVPQIVTSVSGSGGFAGRRQGDE
ncbi:MAG: hypothetical protein M3065_15200 [Actinomycetota bacterium]|nr:hypothetical protein [Actinomycetota bacterium]